MKRKQNNTAFFRTFGGFCTADKGTIWLGGQNILQDVEKIANKTPVLGFARLNDTNYVTIDNLTQAGIERYSRQYRKRAA